MDATAADRLIRHARFARRLARAIVGDDALADDAVQETWLAAVRNPPRTLSAAWIGTVVRNAALRLRRGESRRAAREAAVASGAQASSLWRPEEQAVLREVVDAVLALDEPFRSTVLMRFYEDLPPREIAARQGAPVSTVNSRLQRGLAEVRRRLGVERGDEPVGALLLLAGERRGGPAPLAARVAEGALMGAKTKAAVACAAAVLLVAAAWHTLSPDAPDENSGSASPAAGAAATQRPVTAQTARLRAAAGQPVAASHDTSAATTAEAEGTAKPDFTGVVVVPEGAPVTDGLAWASGAEDGERRILTRVPLRADGTFELSVGDAGAGARDVEVGAVVPGFMLRAERKALTRGSATRVELRLERGARITGTVVDVAGVPVANLRILARSMRCPCEVVDDSILDTDALVAGPFDANVHWAWATTDASGRFAVDGLGPGTYGFLSQSPAWMLTTGDVVPAGAEDLRVVARPAFPVSLRVHDAGSGKALACSADVMFTRRIPGATKQWRRTIEAPRGELGVRWDREAGVAYLLPLAEGESLGEVQVTFTVHAEGFHSRELSVALDANGPQLFDVELDPIVDDALGKLRLEVVDARGAPPDFEIRADLVGEPPAEAEPTVSRLSKVKAGTFVLSASPGRWRLIVGPAGASVGNVRDVRVVDIVAGGAADVRVALPPTGFVVVRRKARQTEYPMITVAADDLHGNAYAITMVDREMRWRIAPGMCRIVVGQGDAARTRDVAVRAFEETVVEIDE
jgi:RNA polymerase sigma-70 factor (ECF subfamily)